MQLKTLINCFCEINSSSKLYSKSRVSKYKAGCIHKKNLKLGEKIKYSTANRTTIYEIEIYIYMCVCVCVCDGEWSGFRFHPIHPFSKEQVLYVFAPLKKRATESNRVWRGKSFSVSDKRSRLPHATLRYAVHIFKPCWPAHVLNLCVSVYVCFFFYSNDI